MAKDLLYRDAPVSVDEMWWLAKQGRLFISSDADQNDVVTGQTSFADTTPTFLLDVPRSVTAVPLFLNLSQTGTVAGGDIQIITEIDKIKRYSTGGTAEKVFTPSKIGTPSCRFYSGATALAGYGIRLMGVTTGADVSPAEGAIQGPFWPPEMPYLLEGPATFLVYIYAATTGPTVFWSFGWAELETRSEL